MRLGDLIDDEQAKPQSLLAPAHRPAKEWLKQLYTGGGRNRRPAVRDTENEIAALCAGRHFYREFRGRHE